MNRHDHIECAWAPFKQEVLFQWRRLSEADLQESGRNRRTLARIIERKYGVAWQLVENYLTHLESSMRHFRDYRHAA